MDSPQDTIAAIATPLGEAGIGVLRVSGPDAIATVSKIFKKSKSSFPTVTGGESRTRPAGPERYKEMGKLGSMDPLPVTAGDDGQWLCQAASHTCHVGWIGTLDQVVVSLFRAPHSYTGEDVVEISAHGNPLTLQKILSLCLQNGTRLAGPGEFTQRAFTNGKMDLTQAEAVAELIHAKSDKAQAAALSQLRGGLASKVRELRDQILPLLAHVEVGLDHADEDHAFITREELTVRCQAVRGEVDVLLRSQRVSKILREGLKVVLLGKPNVGKSSLLNALLKEDRAIVTATPGTTRDTLEERISWNGVPVVLTDTAGVRSHTQDPIEQLGIERTRRSLETADVIVGLFDGSEDLSSEDEAIIREVVQKPHIWVINKHDLPQRLRPDVLDRYNGSAPVVRLSAQTGEGLQELVDMLTRRALGEKATSAEAQWLLNTRHEEALARAASALTQAAEAAQSDAFEECVALELQTALSALGEIIGETTTEDLLDQIFSKFCIGK